MSSDYDVIVLGAGSPGEHCAGAPAEGGLRVAAHVPLDVVSDTIQPFPTFSEIYLAALKALRSEIAARSTAVGTGSRWRA